MTTKATDARLNDVEKFARDAKDKLRHKEDSQLKRDLNDVFSSPAGRRVLCWIINLCGFHKADTVADPTSGEIMIRSTIYNQARRNLYLAIRIHIKKQILIDVEHRGDYKEDLGNDLFE